MLLSANSKYLYNRVASNAAIWGEWIACGPLLIYVVVSLDNKCSMSRMDWLRDDWLLLSMSGRWTVFSSSLHHRLEWESSFSSFHPYSFHGTYCHPTNPQSSDILSTISLDDQALLQFTSVQHTLFRRYQLAWILTIMQPFIVVTYSSCIWWAN